MPRLLLGRLANRRQSVRRRHIAKRQHVFEQCVAANLTALNYGACPGASGPRDFDGVQVLLSLSKIAIG
jgi:hypothetical protein